MLKNKYYIIFFILSVIFIFRINILTAYGEFFVHNDEIVPNNVPIVLLGGNIVVRADYACSIYGEQNSNIFLFFKQPKINDEFLSKYVLNETELTKIILKEKYNINNYNILSLNGAPVTSTYDEALALKSFLRENKIQEIILVTDAFHSYRAYKIYKDILGDNIKIYVKTISLKGQSYDDWWTSEKGIKFYLLELVKFLNYYINKGNYETIDTKL